MSVPAMRARFLPPGAGQDYGAALGNLPDALPDGLGGD
jgi:hypothetical protein